jgi:hypothetical protein
MWEYQYKLIAESSYSLLRGSDFSLQISLPGVIPSRVKCQSTAALVLAEFGIVFLGQRWID